MIYVVLGMHKSGTTLISQALHESGVNMGDFKDELNYDTGNKYERHESQEINRTLLKGHLLPKLSFILGGALLPLYNDAGYKRNRDGIALLVRRDALENRFAQPENRGEIRQMIADCNASYDSWGFKDPRSCLTYNAWKRELPDHKVIVVFRSYTQHFRRYAVNPLKWGMTYRVLHSWTMHNLLVLNYIKEMDKPVLVLSYEQMMSDKSTFDRLSKFAGQEIKDVRDPKMYRNRTSQAPALPSWAKWMIPFLPANPDTVYTELMKLTTQTEVA